MTTKNPDPAQVVADCLDVLNDEDHPEGHALVFARSILRALSGAGWRIVRTEGDEYAGEDVQITEEWTP